jgi:hypothetical protein
MQTNPQALGRYWGSADTVSLKTLPDGDDVAVSFAWSDGAGFVVFYPSRDDATQSLARLGFHPSTR